LQLKLTVLALCSVLSSPVLASGLMLSLTSTEVAIIWALIVLALTLVGLIPAGLLYLKFKKKWVFLLSPIFGVLLYLAYVMIRGY